MIISLRPFYLSQQRPTFAYSCPHTIIGDEELNCRVRNGNGCFLFSMVTGKYHTIFYFKSRQYFTFYNYIPECFITPELYKSSQAARLISTGKLKSLQTLHTQPINLVVYEEPLVLAERDLISGLVSRLDAFSVYPFQT